MKILKMTARFGRLSGEALELGEGLNIVQAPNEWGKSTWCAFIRAMLYGIDTAHRGKAGSVSEKSAALPWSGLSPQGTMEIEYAGRHLTLSRSTQTPARPMGQFSAKHTGSGYNFALTGENCGETLLGVSREVFARSAFIAQGSAAVSGSPDLEKRISSLISTGTDSPSLSDAVQRLKAWQRERCHNSRVGMNARLEAKLAENEEKLRQINAISSQADRLRKDIAAMEGIDPAAGLTQLTVKLKNAEEAERKMRQALDESPFGARDSREVSLELGRAKRECTELLAKSREKYSHAKLIAPALLTAFTIVLAWMKMVEWKIAAVPAAFLGMVTLLSLINACAVAGRRRQAASKRRALLRKWDVSDESGFDRLDESHQENFDRWLRARDEMHSLRRALDARYSAAGSTPEIHRRSLAALEGQLSILGNGAELKTETERLKAAIAENLRQKQDIDLAIELLQEAHRRHTAEFSPKLTRLTAELFSRCTAGRYDGLELDSALGISTRLAGDQIHRGSGHMSDGARQLAYLCLRLAICLLALPEGKSCPIILDDALCSLDDERCRAFLELLAQLGKERQIILFTCHSREARFMRGRAGVTIQEAS